MTLYYPPDQLHLIFRWRWAVHAGTGGCHGPDGRASRDSAFRCRGVTRAFRGELGSSKAVVFQCPTGEYCGGWGDRLAGVFGAAALALYCNASFKVDWPDLRTRMTMSSVFQLRFWPRSQPQTPASFIGLGIGRMPIGPRASTDWGFLTNVCSTLSSPRRLIF